MYYLTHNVVLAKHVWSRCTEYSSSVVNRYPGIYVISCVGEKNGKIKMASSFSAIKLCFVINELSNKTIILFNVAQLCLLPRRLSYIGEIPRDFTV